jgi:hypothetical protein
MLETGELRQDTTAVHDVLSLFRDKTGHDVMNPDRYGYTEMEVEREIDDFLRNWDANDRG